ncbi:hypothetical protein PHAVU_006G054800 [Phaseolus vulgaris]|uniref:SET domain-containing protein n=1 Tax=Phaseolus vulgaris TaxID=3885 RepID=V7BNH6_PHAVU|nr:hypothetical protein PHAVU_006G054800g [Phaseolus vulgaris]ESW18605.1 hypothetical protein PHAVU_006G054800g [Phaseolus vulgaris]
MAKIQDLLLGRNTTNRKVVLSKRRLFVLKIFQMVGRDVGKVFTYASKCGNVGTFTNHSCSSNLRVKDVMHDHNDKNLPHKMLFGVKDILAGRELIYKYNSLNGKLIKSRSSSCYWGTPQGNGQIYI